MKCIPITFSPTGGTEKVAKLLCATLGTEEHTIDLTDRAFPETDIPAVENTVAVISIPSYGGRVPALVAERLKKVHGNGIPCVLVCVYGNRAYEDTLVEMEDLAKECGFTVVAAVAAVAEHSILHQYAAGRPDAADEKDLKKIGGKIAEKLAAPFSSDAFSIPGGRPYKKTGNMGFLPKASSACVGCGLCAKQCPAGAIDPVNLKTTDGTKCISCMRCVVKCPHKAREINSALLTMASLALKKVCSVRKACELYL